MEQPALSCSSGTALVSFRLFPKHLARVWNILGMGRDEEQKRER